MSCIKCPFSLFWGHVLITFIEVLKKPVFMLDYFSLLFDHTLDETVFFMDSILWAFHVHLLDFSYLYSKMTIIVINPDELFVKVR